MSSTPPPLIDLQIAFAADDLPGEADFQQWANAALKQAREDNAPVTAQVMEITVRVVDADESRQLNHEYRGRDYATNVLSFPNELPDFLREQLDVLPLGDLVICVPVVAAEATEQNKVLRQHWAHLTIHGVLHLLGFDHIDDDEADIMEAMEISALDTLGISNPYEAEEDRETKEIL